MKRHPILTLRDIDQMTALELPRVGSVWTMVALTNTGHEWLQPMRILSTHTQYVVARAIPPEGFWLPEERMQEQRFSKHDLHRIRHDGTVDDTHWLRAYDPSDEW